MRIKGAKMAGPIQKPEIAAGMQMRRFAEGGKRAFTQQETLSLAHRLPLVEGILALKELGDAILSGASASINPAAFWRSGEFCVYRRGFELPENLKEPIGKEIVWVEGGIPYKMEIPDVGHPGKKGKDLSSETGMLVFPMHMLIYDETSRTVSVAMDFDEGRDVRAVDVMRAENGYGFIDSSGFPLRYRPIPQQALPREYQNAAARRTVLKYSEQFEVGATGYFGSAALRHDFGNWPAVFISSMWGKLLDVPVRAPQPQSQKE
jgi:hypothetical protein